MHNIACLSDLDHGGRSIIHQLPPDPRQAVVSAQGFADRHCGHDLAFDVLTAVEYLSGRVPRWAENADVKLAYQAAQTLTVTNLQSLASSATAGWQGAVVDNTANLFIDYYWQVVLDFANTAPANQKAAFLFFYSGIVSGTYSNPASGSEGTITLVDFTANPQQLKGPVPLPYTTQDEVTESGAISAAAIMGLPMAPQFHGPVIMNFSGAALAASLNTVKYTGVYATVI